MTEMMSFITGNKMYCNKITKLIHKFYYKL